MINDYIDEGVINLSSAIIENAVSEYEAHLSVCNDLQARICAQTDSKGIVGRIMEFATGDREFLLKMVEEKIRRRYEKAWQKQKPINLEVKNGIKTR